MISRLMLLLCFTMLSRGASADGRSGFLSGTELLDYCNPMILAFDGEKISSPKDVANIAACGSYVRGVLDDYLIGSDSPPVLFCPANTVSPEQMIRVITKYLKDEPRMLDKPAIILIQISLAKAFPCK